MSIGSRIKELRKNHLKMTQTEFGERLGTSLSAIVNIENERLARPEQKEPLYRLICEKFHVNYDWLMTGDGEIFDESQDVFFDKLAERYGLRAYARKILEVYSSLEDKQKDTLESFIYQVSMAVLEDNIAKAQGSIAEAAAKVNSPELASAALIAFYEAFPHKEDLGAVDVAIDKAISAASQDNDIAADIKKTIQQGETAFTQTTTRKK